MPSRYDNDNAARRGTGSRNRGQRKRALSFVEADHPPTVAARTTRRTQDDHTKTFSSSSTSLLASHSRTTHHRSLSSLSRTAVPSRRPSSSSRHLSSPDRPRRQPNPQNPTKVERAVSQLRIYMDTCLNDVKEQLRTWEKNGTSSLSRHHPHPSCYLFFILFFWSVCLCDFSVSEC